MDQSEFSSIFVLEITVLIVRTQYFNHVFLLLGKTHDFAKIPFFGLTEGTPEIMTNFILKIV